MSEDTRKTDVEPPAELESQFLLRLPPTPAAALRAAVRSGVSNLEDRLFIKLENDMRNATVKFDKWCLASKLYDLPTVIESCKTLDRKIFYKTADICQIMIAQEEGESIKSDEESPKKKEKDNKDKRYYYPHGITPPLKNVRKRRFRKTLKKKYVDLPDVEKEVKRLLRTDTDAISVRYEVVNAEDEKNDSKTADSTGISQTEQLAEYDIFGEVLSSSDESNLDEADESAARKLESIIEEQTSEGTKQLPSSPAEPQYADLNDVSQSESAEAGENLGQLLKEQKSEDERMALMQKLSELEHSLTGLQAKRRAQEIEITNIENQALKQRFQSNIDRLKQEEFEKQMEYNDIMSILQDTS